MFVDKGWMSASSSIVMGSYVFTPTPREGDKILSGEGLTLVQSGIFQCAVPHPKPTIGFDESRWEGDGCSSKQPDILFPHLPYPWS